MDELEENTGHTKADHVFECLYFIFWSLHLHILFVQVTHASENFGAKKNQTNIFSLLIEVRKIEVLYLIYFRYTKN
jgi:hypothetical protein